MCFFFLLLLKKQNSHLGSFYGTHTHTAYIKRAPYDIRTYLSMLLHYPVGSIWNIFLKFKDWMQCKIVNVMEDNILLRELKWWLSRMDFYLFNGKSVKLFNVGSFPFQHWNFLAMLFLTISNLIEIREKDTEVKESLNWENKSNAFLRFWVKKIMINTKLSRAFCCIFCFF